METNLDSEEEHRYNFRSSRKRSRSNNLDNIKKKRSRNVRSRKNIKITRDGYISDEFVVDDEYNPDSLYKEVNEQTGNVYFDLDSNPIQKDIIKQLINNNIFDPNQIKNIVKNAFKETGKHLIKDYVGCKPSDEGWKLGLSKSSVNKLEPELKKIRGLIEKETPTFSKIVLK